MTERIHFVQMGCSAGLCGAVVISKSRLRVANSSQKMSDINCPGCLDALTEMQARNKRVMDYNLGKTRHSYEEALRQPPVFKPYEGATLHTNPPLRLCARCGTYTYFSLHSLICQDCEGSPQ